MVGTGKGFDHDDYLSDVGPSESGHSITDLRLHFARLYTETAKFNHIVGSSENVDIAVRGHHRPVARMEPAHTIHNEPFLCAQLGQFMVTARHVVVGDNQLASLS